MIKKLIIALLVGSVFGWYTGALTLGCHSLECAVVFNANKIIKLAKDNLDKDRW